MTVEEAKAQYIAALKAIVADDPTAAVAPASLHTGGPPVSRPTLSGAPVKPSEGQLAQVELRRMRVFTR